MIQSDIELRGLSILLNLGIGVAKAEKRTASAAFRGMDMTSVNLSSHVIPQVLRYTLR